MQSRSLKLLQLLRSRSTAGANVTVTLLLTLALLRIDVAAGRPDVRPSPFALDLQPPLLEPASGVDAFNAKDGQKRALDSYGNPIDALRPIDTPDGRKVVSAQGVQFEIPNYASGITEIRQPADDLLPPHIDAIAVAQPTSSDSISLAPPAPPAPQPATSLTPPNHDSSTSSTEVEVEQAQLVPLQQQQQDQDQQQETAYAPQLASGTLPDYLLELQRQDPLIDGPVPWIPAPHGTPLSVIAWDLLPPLETAPAAQTEPIIITEQQPTKHVVGVVQPGSHNIRITLGSGQALSPVVPVVSQLSSGQVAVVPLLHDGPEQHGTNAHVGSTTPSNAGRFPSRHRGTAHYSTTTSTQRPRSSTTTTTTTTTTRAPTTTSSTVRTTTTPRSTTTTTPRSTTTTTPRTTTPLDPSTFYKLEHEEEYAYTLPPWLQEVTDPDLDVAVTFIVPTDNDQYNHTVAEDLEPPLEPFVDLNNIQLTAPPTEKPSSSSSSSTTSTTTSTSTTSTTTTTTTRRPSSTRSISSSTTTTTSTTKAPIYRAQQEQQKPSLQNQPQLFTASSTTTTTAAAVEPNPFNSATLPPWLQDFDYPDVGPGVPYNPDSYKETNTNGGQQTQLGASKPNDFQPLGFANRPIQSQVTPPTSTPPPTRTTTTTSTTLISSIKPAVSVSSAFPSKVTLPLPAINVAVSELGTEVEPPLVLIPPVALPADIEATSPTANSSSGSANPATNLNPTTNFITHFPARFDTPATATVSAPAPVAGQDAAQPAVDNQKVEYTKSDEGKVISTPVNTQQRKDYPGAASVSPAAPAPAAATPTSASNTGKYTGGFGAPAGLLRPQTAGNERGRPVASAAAPTAANTGRYTGGFGAPAGVLSPQNAPRPFQQTQTQHQAHSQSQSSRSHSGTHSVSGAASSHHQNRFGGPPGILVPFDNVQRTGGQ